MSMKNTEAFLCEVNREDLICVILPSFIREIKQAANQAAGKPSFVETFYICRLVKFAVILKKDRNL